MMLSDLGADVIKVESPGKGDPFRSFSKPAQGISAMFSNVNRGKNSVIVDLKEPEGQRALVDLVRNADVFIHNWRPGIAESLEVPVVSADLIRVQHM
jgi:crotonobetainyl-CoA:carnitine CoA-transferase CaiB-like acyl-CoA transferase